MKYLIILFISILPYFALGQGILVSSDTRIEFFSKTPLEDIKAVNETATSLLNTFDNKLVFRVPIIGFVFKKSLMREHFNENYLESDKYPHATFQGKINEEIDFSKDGEYPATATGKFNIHNVEVERTLEGTILIKDGKVSLKTEFHVLLKDHKIKIPKAVFKNIAEDILVKVEARYIPYSKE